MVPAMVLAPLVYPLGGTVPRVRTGAILLAEEMVIVCISPVTTTDASAENGLLGELGS